MKIYRSSGMPVDKQDKEIYKDGLNQAFDMAEAKFGKWSLDNAAEFNNFVEQEHRNLTVMLPIYHKISFPTSQAEMIQMINHYGSSIAFCEEDGQLVAYVMDR